MTRAFDVLLGRKLIDTVFATGYDAEEMRRSLINHDGYDPRIKVYRRSKTRARITRAAFAFTKRRKP